MKIKAFVRNLGHHFWVLLVGLAVTCFFIFVGISASQSTVVVFNENLNQYWRTTYDILVRPTGSRSSIEESYGLVEANYLSGINGGISFDQYYLVRSIPGVEIAAPIAMVGYISWYGDMKSFGVLTEPGAYVLEETFHVEDGITPDFTLRTYYFIAPGEEMSFFGDASGPHLYVNPYGPVVGNFQTGLLVAGIDPVQESMLVGLDEAVIDGRYFVNNEPLFPIPYLGTHAYCPPDYCPEFEIALPMLVNDNIYVSLEDHAVLRHLDLPPEINTTDALISRGGIEFLASCPGEVIDSNVTDSTWVHRTMLENLEVSSDLTGTSLYGLPASLEYQEISNPFGNDQRSVEIVLPVYENLNLYYFPYQMYRFLVNGNNTEEMLESLRLVTAYRNSYIGTFNMELLPRPVDVNRVPLETYYPPIVLLRYDEHGNPVNPPVELHPSPNAAGYIQSPPLILTTMEAARALRGDNAISAIRIRVAGVDELTLENQRKIEAVASEIMRRTGLDVDIMVGSSPTPVLVHVPGVGYVEEQWIQENVTFTYQTKVQTGHWLLMGTLLVISGFYTLDMAWVGMETKRKQVALQKALGWRSSSIFFRVIIEVILAAILASFVGTLTAWGIGMGLEWQRPTLKLFVSIPLALVMIAALGGAYPAWLSTKVPPIVELREGGVKNRRRTKGIGIHRIWMYAWEGLLRSPTRTILNILNTATSIALMTLFFSVLLEQHGSLSGTLLGQFILVQVKGYHLGIACVGMLLTVFSVMNNLVAGVIARRREIGVLKALGWRDDMVTRLFLVEGILIGLMGGLLGVIIGLGLYATLYGVLTSTLLWVGLVGVGVACVVGCLGGLYPSLLATRVLPAEAVRHE